MPSYWSICMVCRHRRALGCDAYPEGIPTEIMDGSETHFEARPGDHGVRFEIEDGPEAAALAEQLVPVFGEKVRGQ